MGNRPTGARAWAAMESRPTTAEGEGNNCLGRRAVTGFISRYPDAELKTAENGQYVKVSGVVTCGNVPLELPFQRIPRCVYTSTSLYEYRGWDSKAANAKHRRFTWGLRSLEDGYEFYGYNAD
ncbi:unnamed protein product [Victoria cruziana]